MGQSDKRAQGVTLDQAVILGEVQEFKKALEELKRTLEQVGERLTKVETDASVTETGLHLIYAALEAGGLMKNGEPVEVARKGRPTTAVSEETFTCLKFEEQRGAKLGEYSVAYKQNNLVDKWTSAFNILRQSNATIKTRYCGQNYQFSYWLYGEGKIYRQKLKPKTEAKP